MSSKKLHVVFSALVGLALILSACGPAATPTPVTIIQTVEVPVTVAPEVAPDALTACQGSNMAYLSFGSQFAFIAIVDESMRRAAEEAGVNLVYLDNEFSPDKAVENAEIVASRGDIDLVFEFNYYQQQNYVIADIFTEAGIPVIAIDIPIPGATYYGGDNYLAGKLAGIGLGEWAAARWGEEPVDLVMVEQQSLAGQQTLEARTLGIIAGIHQALPYLTDDQIVRFEGENNPDAAGEAVATQLTAHPDAQRVLIGMLGDSNAIAAANSATEAGRDVGVSGIGGDDVGIQALRSSDPANFVGSSLFLPEHYGDDLIPLGCRLLAGEQIPAEVFVSHVFLNAANLNEYYPE
jgi:ribose transport system substrate-binding protein